MSPGHHLVCATDTLVASLHFPVEASAEQIATRALCVNLSDMAAMGATPKWFTLALTTPQNLANAHWLEGFSRGLAKIANQFNVALVGGDTTAGPLTISLTLMGEVPNGDALQRDGAAVEDAIYVTGTLGDGAASLDIIKGHPKQISSPERLLKRFYEPQPQIEVATKLRNIASACIDISDGLIADLGHICKASGVCGHIETQLLPVHGELVEAWPQQYLGWALTGGDDYQLCFTVPLVHREMVDQWIDQGELEATLVGQMLAPINSDDLVIVDGQSSTVFNGGFDHFSR